VTVPINVKTKTKRSRVDVDDDSDSVMMEKKRSHVDVDLSQEDKKMNDPELDELEELGGGYIDDSDEDPDHTGTYDGDIDKNYVQSR